MIREKVRKDGTHLKGFFGCIVMVDIFFAACPRVGQKDLNLYVILCVHSLRVHRHSKWFVRGIYTIRCQ